ncbi:unnamed protein product [Sphagnum troendelagicum]|uniref:Small ribosomal subunit protein uS10 domain-containing protein n=1 Tax=Sphagnum troendelagicum TaxID=128251 RepID=A0ABP0T7Y9_9BRYO
MASAMVTTTTATTLLLPFSSSSSSSSSSTRTSLTVVPLASCSSSSSSSFSSPSKADPFNAGHHLLTSEEGLRTQGLVCNSSRPGNLLWESYGLTTASKSPRLSVRATAAAPKQKIRIKLRSYWVPLIEQACQQILEAARNSNSQTMGPVPLPTKKRVYCVLRSPHVNKDSREHFEIRTHRRLIDLENPNAQTIDALMQLDLPAGVDVEVKLS